MSKKITLESLGINTAEPEPAEPAKRRPPAKKAQTAQAPATSRQPAKDTPAAKTGRQRPAQPARKATQPASTGASSQSYPRRVNLHITNDDWRALATARVEDDIDMATRLRTMIRLWRKDPRMRARIDREAHSSGGN